MSDFRPLVLTVPHPSRAVSARRRLRPLASGDGAARPGLLPTLSVSPPRLSPAAAEAAAAAAWRSRVDACQAEAQAALHRPFSPPATWSP